jgi:hypothetical protein
VIVLFEIVTVCPLVGVVFGIEVEPEVVFIVVRLELVAVVVVLGAGVVEAVVVVVDVEMGR